MWMFIAACFQYVTIETYLNIILHAVDVSVAVWVFQEVHSP